MSWAAQNPEKYDEITRKGIRSYLEHTIEQAGYSLVVDDDTLLALVEIIQEDQRFKLVYDVLSSLANERICDAYTNHFAGLADAARDRQKDKGV